MLVKAEIYEVDAEGRVRWSGESDGKQQEWYAIKKCHEN